MKRTSVYNIGVSAALLLSLQSCFVVKDYNRPEEVVEETNFRTDELPEDTVSMAEISWREIFADPVLTDHIEEGLKENIDIRIALQRIEAAGAYLRQSRMSQLPSISAGLTAAHQEFPRSSSSRNIQNSVDQWELFANLSWEADIWGKIQSNKKATRAAYLQSVAGHQAVKTELIANIASLYYQLLALDEQLRVTLETVENRQNSLETIRALKEAGMVTEVGVKQTEAQYFRAQTVVIDIQNQIRLFENTLSILLGDAPHSIARTSLDEQEIKTPLKTGVPLQLLRNRPDVIAAEYALINAFELTNVARSEFYPSLRISANGGLQSLKLENLLNANSLFASVVGSLAQPIFNRRQIRTQYEVAQAEQEIAYLDFRRTILLAMREVSDALYNYEAALEKLKIKDREYEAYDLATSYSEELLNNGLANYLEVLTARENALNARLELIQIKFDKLNSVINLYEALGGGWK